MEELKQFYSKSLNHYIVADGKTMLQINGTLAVCTKAQLDTATNNVTAHLVRYELVTKDNDGREKGIFEVNSMVKVIEEFDIIVTDATALVKAE